MEQTHPNREELAAFVNGALPDDERRRLEEHVAVCASCCDVLREVPCEPLIGDPLKDTGSWSSDTLFSPQTPACTDEPDAVPVELENHPRYRLLKKLGAGGMGVVYQAEHRLMQRPVAVKIISRRLVGNPIAIERFHLEVRGAAKLSHRNIVTAHDAEQAGDLHFLVMEFIEGESLNEVVARRGQLSALHACNYISQAANGLQHAHEQGMVHRDIKPHNLMRTSTGTIKILDFGLARFASQQTSETNNSGLTSDGITLGTPDYIAPEQARDSRRADIRADIYSLGCTLYYLLTARVPFPEGSAIDKIVAHCERSPTPLAELRDDLPVAVVRAVERMMSKDPADRPQTPREVAEALKPYSKPAPIRDAATIDTTSLETAREPTAQHTFVDRSPTLPPLEDGDPFDLKKLELPPPAPASRRLAGRQKPGDLLLWLRRRRTAVISVGAGLALLLLGALFLPRIFDTFRNDREINGGGGSTEELGEWRDLIAAVDPGDGDWHKEGDELIVEAVVDARLPLPFEPTREYDLEATFTRLSGSNSVALMFVMGGRQATFEVDGWGERLAGIQNIDGEAFTTNATRVVDMQLRNGRRYRLAVRVRCDRVDGFLDDRLVATYKGDGSNLSLLDGWQLPPRTIGVGAYKSRTVFHEIRVRPLHKP